MKSALLVVLLAAAASAAVVGNEVPEVVEVPDVDQLADVEEMLDVDEVADVDINDIPEVFVNDVETAELIDEPEMPMQSTVFSRRNLNQGNITSGDTRVVNREFRTNGTVGISKVRIILVRTKRPISAIRVNRVGDSQNATPSIVKGGIGKSFVIIRIKSARGRGYHYRVEVYVR